MNPADGPAPGQDAPAARNLTDAKGARASIYAVPKPTPDVIYVGLNDRDAAWHDLYKVTISTGARELVRKNTERIAGLAVRQQRRRSGWRRASRTRATPRCCRSRPTD